jgi:peptide/nickel transport system ATP-binding protein
MTTALLRIRGLAVRYSSGPAVLDDLDLDVFPGECLALVGESGCGKTTLARAVLGLLPRHATVTGTIELLGTDLGQASAKSRRALLGQHLGYVAQDPYAACDPIRTVRHHIEEAWRAHGDSVAPDVIAERVSALGIGAAAIRLRDRPHQWSGGMLQRASISAATAYDPELVLADEPTSALDAELADGVLRAVRGASRGLLLISHDLRLVENHADRVAVLHGGRIIETGRTSAVTTTPSHAYTRQLLASADSIRSAPRPAAAPRSAPAPSRAAAAPPVVTIDQASVTYRSGASVVQALRGASLTIGAGEIVGIAGPSGSGKSTLLRIASGIEAPGEGTVTFAGGQASAPRGYVMPVFQDPVASLDRRWPIWRSLTEPATVGGHLSRAERLQLARDALAQVRLDGLDQHRLPGQLSVGQCQRVAIARALIARPALIVADEPTASLDVTTAADIVDLLRLARQSGVAIALVSHDEALLAAVADRIVRIRDGVTMPADQPDADPPDADQPDADQPDADQPDADPPDADPPDADPPDADDVAGTGFRR